MKYLKLENAWMVLETGKKINFGHIALSLYKFWFKIYNDYNKEIEQLLESGRFSKENVNALKIRFSIEETHVLELFLNVIDVYLGDHNAKIETNMFNPIKTEYTSLDEQINKHLETINRVKANGWMNVQDDYAINLVDWYLLNEFNMDTNTLNVTQHLYNNKWYPAYERTNETDEVLIAMIDLQELRNQSYNFKRCIHCNEIFVQKDGRNKYCENCSKNYKKIADQKRKQTPRGKHKIVCNYLRNAGSFSDIEIGDFMRESNYYWDNLQGKSVKREKTFTSNISTEKEYVYWLEKCHNNFKSEAKHRKHT